VNLILQIAIDRLRMGGRGRSSFLILLPLEEDEETKVDE